jgi:hypothetical protein
LFGFPGLKRDALRLNRFHRHCEERSDAAIQLRAGKRAAKKHLDVRPFSVGALRARWIAASSLRSSSQ